MAAPVYELFINAVDRAATNVLLEGFSLREVTNGIDTLVCKVESEDASLRPAKRQEVFVTEDGITIYGGVIRGAREQGHGQPADEIDNIVTEIECDDFSQYFSRRFIDITFAGGTLKEFATAFTTFFSSAPFSITLDAAQVDGPTLPEIVFETERGDDVLNFVAALTAKYGAPFQWRIGYDKVWGFYQAGADPAPWNFIEGDGTETGDVIVEPTDDTYANKIWGVFGSGKVVTTTDTFTTNGIINSFPLKFKLVGPLPGAGYGAVGQGIVIFNGITATLANPGLGYEWEYDPVTNSVSRAAGPPSAGTLEIPYDGLQKFLLFAQDLAEIAANGLWEDKIVDEDVTDPVLGQDVLDAELARRLVQAKIVRIQTRRVPGPRPGQSITLTYPKRNLSGSFTVVDVTTEYEEGSDVLLRTVTCTSSVYEHWRQTLTRWWSPNESSPSVGSAPAGGAGVPAPPLYSIQSNRPLGRFFGEGYLLYYPLFFGGGGSPFSRSGLIFPGVAGEFDDDFRAEMGMLDENGDFSIDVFGPGDRGASPVVNPISTLINTAGDIFITSGTSAPNPPVTSPPTEWYWGGIFLTGNDSLTSGYAAAGGFFSGGFSPGFQVIPGPQHDSVSHMVGFTLLDAIGLKYHPIDNIVASLPFTIDTDGVSDVGSYSTFISTAGTGTITLPPVGSTGSPNYFVWPVTGHGRVLLVANHSSGTLTVSGGGNNINGSASIALGPFSAVVVERFSDVSTGKWVILSTHGSVTGGGGIGSGVTVPGADKDVIFNDGGVLGADTGALTYDKSIQQLGLDSAKTDTNDYTQIRLTHTSDLGGILGLYSGGTSLGDYYGEIHFGMEIINNVYTARRANPSYFWSQDVGNPSDGIGAEVVIDEVAGAPAAFAKGRGFFIGEDGVFKVYQYGGIGAGSPPTGHGCIVYAERNDLGGGAAGVLAAEDKNGTPSYIWVDGTGVWRYSSAPPEADGTPSDTSGTPFGTAAPPFALLTSDPGAPSDDTWWVVRENTSPQSASVKARIGGVTVTIASVTY